MPDGVVGSAPEEAEGRRTLVGVNVADAGSVGGSREARRHACDKRAPCHLFARDAPLTAAEGDVERQCLIELGSGEVAARTAHDQSGGRRVAVSIGFLPAYVVDAQFSPVDGREESE